MNATPIVLAAGWLTAVAAVAVPIAAHADTPEPAPIQQWTQVGAVTSGPECATVLPVAGCP